MRRIEMSLDLAIGNLQNEARKCVKDKYRHRIKLGISACDVKKLYEKQYGNEGTMEIQEIEEFVLEKAKSGGG